MIASLENKLGKGAPRFFQERGFVPQDLVRNGGLGCNEYVFRRPS